MAVQFTKPPPKPAAPADDNTPPWDEHLPGDEVKAKVGMSTVTVEKLKKVDPDKAPQVVSTKEDVALHPMPKPAPGVKLATVGVSGAMTLNLGNYESAKIGVFLSLPCPVDEIDATYDKASSWVSDRINAAVEEAKSGTPAAPVAPSHHL